MSKYHCDFKIIIADPSYCHYQKQCVNNAVAENIFGLLKSEMYHKVHFKMVMNGLIKRMNIENYNTTGFNANYKA